VMADIRAKIILGFVVDIRHASTYNTEFHTGTCEILVDLAQSINAGVSESLRLERLHRLEAVFAGTEGHRTQDGSQAHHEANKLFLLSFFHRLAPEGRVESKMEPRSPSGR